MDLFLIPSYKHSFPTQRRNPMKLRMESEAHRQRDPSGSPKGKEGWEGPELQPNLRGWLGGEAFPPLEQQMCSSQKAPTHCVLRLPTQSFRHKGASLKVGVQIPSSQLSLTPSHSAVLIQEPGTLRNSDLLHIQ